MRLDLEQIADVLPDVVHQMIDVIGFSDTQKVIENFGGAEFKFTDGKHYFPRLKAVLGLESAVKLRQYFNIEQVYIPRCDAALRLARNYQFKAEFDMLTKAQGMSARLAMLELCPKFKISDRRAWEILQELQCADTSRQTALF